MTLYFLLKFYLICFYLKFLIFSSIEEESLESTTPRDTTISSETPKTPRNKDTTIKNELESFIKSQSNSQSSSNPAREYPEFSNSTTKPSKRSLRNIKRQLSNSRRFSRMTEALAKRFQLNVTTFGNEVVFIFK